jgi:hypothetical protein
MNSPSPSEPNMKTTHLIPYGKAAYLAYCKAVGGKALNGDDLPAFEQTPEKIQTAWDMSAFAVLELHNAQESLPKSP